MEKRPKIKALTFKHDIQLVKKKKTGLAKHFLLITSYFCNINKQMKYRMAFLWHSKMYLNIDRSTFIDLCTNSLAA